MENKEVINTMNKLQIELLDLICEQEDDNRRMEVVYPKLLGLAKEAYEAGHNEVNETWGKLIYRMQSNPPLNYTNFDEWIKNKI